jgi:putative addiction module component (TIGR02574 family)
MNADLLAEVLKLSPSERLELIGALWDTLAEGDLPVTPEERALLDRRLADLENDPGTQSPWSEVKARLERPSSTWRELRTGTTASKLASVENSALRWTLPSCGSPIICDARRGDEVRRSLPRIVQAWAVCDRRVPLSTVPSARE